MDKLGVGVAYNYVTANIDVAKSDFSGALDWEYDGFLLFFKFTFGSIGKTAAK